MPADFILPVAFHFSVSFAGSGIQVRDAAFQEVSGLDSSLELEPVQEGGENRFVHQLPKRVTQTNLKLRRGLTDRQSGLYNWCRATLEGNYARPIQTKDIVVNLLDQQQDPVASWSIGNAFPVKWTLGGFDAMRNEIAVETVELSFLTLKRTL